MAEILKRWCGFGTFSEAAASEYVAVSKRAFGEGGLGVEDKVVGGMTEAGFFQRRTMKSTGSRQVLP